MELVKSRTQIQESKIITGPFQTFRDIYRKQGLKGIFKGLNITFLREGLGFGIYFSTYEWLTRNNDSKPISTLHLLGAGGTAGAASWMFTYPLDVIKSRIQIDGMSGMKIIIIIKVPSTIRFLIYVFLKVTNNIKTVLTV